MRKPAFGICENRGADQLPVSDQGLCFRYLVQFLLFLYPKFQASSHLLWLYSPFCVGHGRKNLKTGFLVTQLKNMLANRIGGTI